MVWNALFVFVSSMWVVTSMEGYYQPPRGSSVWGYFTPPLLQRDPPHSHQSAMDAMVDLTNNLGVAILQDNTFSRGNFAFSPYGVASVLVVLYEGARGESARQIHRAVGFPSDKDLIRVGFRDIHRHLRSYFSHEGYLSGISLNKETSSLKTEYKRILRFYGYDIDLEQTLDDEDGDFVLEKPSTASHTQDEPNRTTTATPPSASANPGSTASSQDVKKPDSGDSVTENTTSLENTIKDISTAESTTNKLISTLPSTEPSVVEPETTIDGVKPIQKATEPVEAAEEAPVDNTKPAEDVSQPDKSADEFPADNTKPVENTVEPATDKSPLGETEPQNEQEMGTTIQPTSTTKQTTVTEQPPKEEMVQTTTPTPESSVTKATTSLNPTPVSETKKVVTTTEGVSQIEHQTSSTVENMSSGTEAQSIEDKEENTTENLKEEANVPGLSDGQQPQLGTSFKPKDVLTEAATEGTTTVHEAETTESTKTEEFTNSPLDNGMLIPQSEALVGTTTSPTGKKSEPPLTSTSAIRDKAATARFEGITDSQSQGTDSLPETERRSPGKNIIKMSGRKLDPEEKKRIRNMVDVRVPLWLVEAKKSRKIRTITDYLKSPRNPDLSLQLQNGMYDTHVSRNADLYRSLPRLLFLVDGAVDTPVPMMTYTNVFPYAYIPKLHSKALEFPLDDVRYKLLILLPVERRGLRQLIYDLMDYPLRNVLDAMKPARVKAIVPTFMVEGFVILTSSLQKLGIWDVFDPRKANLSGMSMDPELYVRNVEQSVTVVIRNYVEILDIQTRTMAARYMEYEFEATHPFLYFVLDTSTNVALMAGQILDPLNSRIY